MFSFLLEMSGYMGVMGFPSNLYFPQIQCFYVSLHLFAKDKEWLCVCVFKENGFEFYVIESENISEPIKYMYKQNLADTTNSHGSKLWGA
jgi:hypothetical protein